MAVMLSCIGLTFILKYGSILSFIRKPLVKISFFKELFGCSLCLGFWSGVFHGVLFYIFIEQSYVCFLLPTVSSFLSWLFDGVIDYIHTNSIHLGRKDVIAKKQLDHMEDAKKNQQKIIEASNSMHNLKAKNNPVFGEINKSQEINQGTPCKSCGKK